MITFNDMLDKQMQDNEFRKEYEAIQFEMVDIREEIDFRNTLNIVQKKLD